MMAVARLLVLAAVACVALGVVRVLLCERPSARTVSCTDSPSLVLPDYVLGHGRRLCCAWMSVVRACMTELAEQPPLIFGACTEGSHDCVHEQSCPRCIVASCLQPSFGVDPTPCSPQTLTLTLLVVPPCFSATAISTPICQPTLIEVREPMAAPACVLAACASAIACVAAQGAARASPLSRAGAISPRARRRKSPLPHRPPHHSHTY
jgi:hypothetical protein